MPGISTAPQTMGSAQYSPGIIIFSVICFWSWKRSCNVMSKHKSSLNSCCYQRLWLSGSNPFGFHFSFAFYELTNFVVRTGNLSWKLMYQKLTLLSVLRQWSYRTHTLATGRRTSGCGCEMMPCHIRIIRSTTRHCKTKCKDRWMQALLAVGGGILKGKEWLS